MGRHWMLLTQVSGPHVIVCFIIRIGGGVQFLTIIFIFCCRGQLVTEMTGVLLNKIQGETVVPAGRLQGLQCQLLLWWIIPY